MIWDFSPPRRKTVPWSCEWRWVGVRGGACGGWVCGLLWFVYVRLVRFARLFHLFPVFEFGIGIMVGRVWIGLGVCSGGSWVEGCLIDLCRESGGPINYDSRSGAIVLTQVLLGFLVVPPTHRKLSGGRIWSFDATIHCRLLFWSPLVLMKN